MQAALGEVVAVEGDVEDAEDFVAAQFLEQGLGNPDAAGVDADEARRVDVAFGEMVAQVGGHARQEFGGAGQGHDIS
ncbi:hypothetical protein D3C81_2031890 [compost metagenome]